VRILATLSTFGEYRKNGPRDPLSGRDVRIRDLLGCSLLLFCQIAEAALDRLGGKASLIARIPSRFQLSVQHEIGMRVLV